MFPNYPPDIAEEAMNIIARVVGRHPEARAREVAQHKENLEFLKKTLKIN